MKVLIMSVKAGYGHHSTAQAIMDCLSECGHESIMLDIFDYIDPKLCDTIDGGYVFSTKNFPNVYRRAYNKLNKRVKPYKKRSPIALISKYVSNKLCDYIEEYSPDIVVGTHSFACMVMTYLKEKELMKCPTIGIVTDFTIHPLWESTNIDYYVTADVLLNNQMRKKGIAENKIIPFGIPINRKFIKKLSKKEAREQLGIENKRTILLMMGSMGYGNIEKQIAAIVDMDIDMQVLCVCGKNEKMKKEIDSHIEWKKKITTYGFVDNVDVMMDAADCIITKPGGLTSSELLAKRLPAIVMNPIPGQEDRNLEFLVNNGAALCVTDTFTIDEALYEMFAQPWRIRLLKLAVTRLSKPNSTVMLCDFMENLVMQEKGH